MYNRKVRYEYISMEESFPLFVESIGYNPYEQDFNRPEGYPYYHWLQTVEGNGRFSFHGQDYLLSKGRGILLKPYTPHMYYSLGKKWSTIYITFGGKSAGSILDALNMNHSSIYTDLRNLQVEIMMQDMLQKIKLDSEFSKIDLSIYLYNFLLNLKKYGKMNSQPSLSYLYDKVRKIVDWLEIHYAEDITLDEMAKQLNVSSQYLNKLFQKTFQISPYTFLIQLRIRKAKEILLQNPEVPVKNVAILVGFNNLSYFISTFKKREGVTPKKYRDMYGKDNKMTVK